MKDRCSKGTEGCLYALSYLDHECRFENTDSEIVLLRAVAEASERLIFAIYEKDLTSNLMDALTAWKERTK